MIGAPRAAGMLARVPVERASRTAWLGYKAEVVRLIRGLVAPDVIEIGAGRSPLFAPGELPGNVASYTLGDISPAELARAPECWPKACFDVCGDVASYAERFDLVITNMLAEHVSDGRRFHANVHAMLRPGGIAFHFMPTLYCPPFVLNWLLPEALSRRILRLFFPQRGDEGIPKFPARYSLCRGATRAQHARLRALGYADVQIRSFYGHDYFARIPGLRELDAGLTRLAAVRDYASLGAYAYVELRKAPAVRAST